MIIQQKTITVLVADEGKVLVRKSDGWVAGEQLTLGYNYYEAGVPLSEARLETPEDYEEAEKPDDYEAPQVIDQAKRLGVMHGIFEQTRKEVNSYALSAEDAEAHADWFPQWKVGIDVKKGERYRYEGKLYQCLQDHTTQALWFPGDINTAALWGGVADPASDNDGSTPDKAIAYEQGMTLEQGKYYSQGGVVYECIQPMPTGMPYDLAQLPAIVKPISE